MAIQIWNIKSEPLNSLTLFPNINYYFLLPTVRALYYTSTHFFAVEFYTEIWFSPRGGNRIHTHLVRYNHGWLCSENGKSTEYILMLDLSGRNTGGHWQLVYHLANITHLSLCPPFDLTEPNNAHMCHQCSKFFCNRCITQWLTTRQECPHCRKTLTRDRLVQCRWMNDVCASLVELGVNNTTSTTSREITIDERGDGNYNGSMCAEHPTQPKDVFCLNCQMAICSQVSHTIPFIDNIFSLYILFATFRPFYRHHQAFG